MPKHVPERTCIVTRATNPQGGLMRFVVGPNGAVVFDLKGRLPGRGAYVTPSAADVAQAVRKRLFARAFKAEVTVSPTLPDEIDATLIRDLVGALSLANKAGAVAAGFFKVEASLASGAAAALIHASDAAPDGRRKLAGALRKGARDTISPVAVLDDLPSSDLDMALGRVHVIHAALLAGTGGEGCLARWRRLRRFRGLDDAAATPGDDADQHVPQGAG